MAKKKPVKLSALDAAAMLLEQTRGPLTVRAMIEVMARGKSWVSPAGKTPHATLYSAIAREIRTKGQNSRFVKVGRGKFQAR